MLRGKAWAKFLLGFLIVIAFVHSFSHFLFFGTKIPGVLEKGVSGFSIGDFDVGESFTENFPFGITFSQILVVIEWIAVFSFFVAMYVKKRRLLKLEYVDLHAEKKKIIAGTKTDLDALYDFLKSKKRISLITIKRVFNVNKDVVEDWARTLESGGLAYLDYPRMESPILVLKEEGNEKEKKI